MREENRALGTLDSIKDKGKIRRTGSKRENEWLLILFPYSHFIYISIFLAAKCSTKNQSVSLHVLFGAISFFAIYSKNLQATHTYPTFFCGCLMKKKTFIFTPFHSTFRNTQCKIFFSFYKH